MQRVCPVNKADCVNKKRWRHQAHLDARDVRWLLAAAVFPLPAFLLGFTGRLQLIRVQARLQTHYQSRHVLC